MSCPSAKIVLDPGTDFRCRFGVLLLDVVPAGVVGHVSVLTCYGGHSRRRRLGPW